MGHNDHIDFALSDKLEDLINEGYLEEGTPALGIVKQVINQGEEFLSAKQKYVFDTVVVPLLKKRGEELEIQNIINRNPE